MWSNGDGNFIHSLEGKTANFEGIFLKLVPTPWNIKFKILKIKSFPHFKKLHTQWNYSLNFSQLMNSTWCASFPLRSLLRFWTSLAPFNSFFQRKSKSEVLIKSLQLLKLISKKISMDKINVRKKLRKNPSNNICRFF